MNILMSSPGSCLVPTSVRPDELCVNGMSFSMRQSQWANSALVVGVSPDDMEELCGSNPLRGRSRGLTSHVYRETALTSYLNRSGVAADHGATSRCNGRWMTSLCPFALHERTFHRLNTVIQAVIW